MYKNLVKLLLVCAVTLGAIVLVRPPSASTNKLTFDFLDVGQGDSILLTTPSGFQILIDGGPDQSVLDRLHEVMPLTDRSIDLVILSHPDADHLNGLLDIVRDYQIGKLIRPQVEKDTLRYKSFLALVTEKNIETLVIVQPQQIELPDNLHMSILHPGPDTYHVGESANDASIVLRLDYGQRSFLFTGDIEEGIEERLVTRWPQEIDVDVLKVPHHGSKTSSTIDFLQIISPAVAVAQIGRDNKYGHPSALVLDRFDRLDIDIWRTDLEGSIRLETDGQQVQKSGDCLAIVATFFPCQPQKVYTFSEDH